MWDWGEEYKPAYYTIPPTFVRLKCPIAKLFLMIKLTAKTSRLFTSSPPHREAWACFSPTSAEDRRLPSGGNSSLWIRTRGHSWDFLAQHLSVCREHVLGGPVRGQVVTLSPLSTTEKASKNQVACYKGNDAKLSSDFFTSAFHARRQWSNTKR